jgi:hypothetical protein
MSGVWQWQCTKRRESDCQQNSHSWSEESSKAYCIVCLCSLPYVSALELSMFKLENLKTYAQHDVSCLVWPFAQSLRQAVCDTVSRHSPHQVITSVESRQLCSSCCHQIIDTKIVSALSYDRCLARAISRKRTISAFSKLL